MNASFLLQIILRLRSESPRFFKTLQLLCGLLALLAGGFVYLLEKGLLEVPHQQAWEEVAKSVTSFLGGGFVAALLGTNNPQLMDDRTKAKVAEHLGA